MDKIKLRMYVVICETLEKAVDILETQGNIFTIKAFFSKNEDSYYLVFKNVQEENAGNKLPADAESV